MAFQTSLFDDSTIEYAVRKIHIGDALPFLKHIHYARRVPSITYAFGLFHHADLVGCVTYGTPPSSTLCRGICGDQFQTIVLELNRLVLKNNLPNEASRLVAGSLKLLPKPKIVVSFADTAQGHSGFVYQATNFLYTGKSAKFVDPVVKGLEHQHHATYAHGMTNKQVIETYGLQNVTFVQRSRKHRYVLFLGSRTEKAKLRAALRYKVLPYPKGDDD